MLFNSLHFIVFFPVTLLLFFAIPTRFRWVVLLFAGYYFYATWQVPLPLDFQLFGHKITNSFLLVLFQARYTFLLFLLSVVNYFIGIWLGESKTEKNRDRLFLAGVLLNVFTLFYYKYYNFFVSNLPDSFGIPHLDIILPLGISFFVFQKIAYLFEIHKRRFAPEKNFGIFMVYCSFFPQLIAGPIERPQNLLPQLNNLKPFNQADFVAGLRQILWGLFKKVVVADRLSYFTNIVYNNPDDYHGIPVIMATVFFTFQIYCDFSGYSDIALGAARMMGVHLMTNFRTPYFATSIQEFWSRWHISLSTWFKDYLYIPLGGNRVSTPRWVFNLFFIFLVSGIWHGANWTFIIWGLIHGLFNSIESVNKKYNYINFNAPNWLRHLYTFIIVAFAWVFFRANSVQDAFTIFGNMFSFPANLFGEIKSLQATALLNFALGIPLITMLVLFELLQENVKAVAVFNERKYIKIISYIILIIVIAFWGVFVNQASFIYFQF